MNDDRDMSESEMASPTETDIASAGRSCMAILVLLVAILLLIGIWLLVRSTGIGQ